MANCITKVVSISGVPHVCILAGKDIHPGDELRYDYGGGDLPWRKVKRYYIYYKLICILLTYG